MLPKTSDAYRIFTSMPPREKFRRLHPYFRDQTVKLLNDPNASVARVLALDLEGVHDLKLHHPSSSVATSNQ